MTTPCVHVLVINWNGMEHVQACFDSLLASTYPNARFILVDNASTDGSVAFVRDTYGADPRVDILECGRNLGWAGGNNYGMERALESGADYVFLLNNDTATEPDAIAHLVAAAEANPNAGALAPKMLMFWNPRLINSTGLACSRIASSWDIGIGRLDTPVFNTTRRVIGVSGGAAFYRAAALRTAGLLPPDFDIYLDDLDICLRMWDAGYEVWTCPEAVVRHKFSATMGQGKQARRKYYLNTRNRARVLLLNFPLARIAGVLPAFLLGELRAVTRALLNGEPWRAAAHARSWGAALGYLPHAIRTRRRHPPKGRFWNLILDRPAFFQGTEFPRDGWYAPRTVNGTPVRPMSAVATVEAHGRLLRVLHVNCYPALGATSIEVRQNGTVIDVLSTLDAAQTAIPVAPGTVEFAAAKIYDAEATGERFDIGGWLAISDDGDVGTRNN